MNRTQVLMTLAMAVLATVLVLAATWPAGQQQAAGQDDLVPTPQIRHELAGPQHVQQWQRMLDRFDSNGDGVIERAEWPLEMARFDRLDVDGDGRIDRDEGLDAIVRRGSRPDAANPDASEFNPEPTQRRPRMPERELYDNPVPSRLAPRDGSAPPPVDVARALS